MPRVADVYAAMPSITGKIELEYEGELIGGQAIARELIRRAADATLRERAGVVNADEVVMWFDVGGALEVTDDASAEMLVKGFAIGANTSRYRPRRRAGVRRATSSMTAAACELVLEALVARKKISRTDAGRYGRAVQEQRRRPNQDLFGGGMSA